MDYKNLKLIGTSHIAKQSLEDVRKAITEGKPDIVALELDQRRLVALMRKKKSKINLLDIRHIGLKGYIFSLIGAWAERKLGEYVGVAPGSEMVLAAKLAKREKIRIALVDQDIEITLKRLSKTLSWKEKWNFFADIIKAIVLRKKEVEFDLRTVPNKKIIDKLIGKVKKRYPNVYKVLIKERNHIMATRFHKLMAENQDKKILGIIGAGHEEEIIGIIRKIKQHKIEYPSISYSYSIK